MGTPLPEEKSAQMFVYYYLMTGDRKVSFLLANYFPNGLPSNCRGKNNKAWRSPELQNLLRETVSDMAKLRINKPKNIPEAKIETVENVIATAEEVLIYLTACMRGQITEEMLLTRSCGEGEQVIERLRKEVTPRDRTKAAELLAKRYGLLEHKLSLDINAPVVFLGEGELEE